MSRPSVLFVCTANSIRSQMAEAYLRHFAGDQWDVWSAGVSPASIHPLTSVVMMEDGIVLDQHYSKGLSDIRSQVFDHVITLCDYARHHCVDLGQCSKHQHWSIQDPIHTLGNHGVMLNQFRRTRDDIRKKIRNWLDQTPISAGGPAHNVSG